ncbi:MAG: hypothetical protein M1827_007268 [Pycnora praestabilis]|nr:MAG: hypothetical protein M1827_007268 [Pycnora praestabilis]
MVFQSNLPKPSPPTSDAFNYIFHEGRRDYPRDRVLYRSDETNETLTLEELEDNSRRFASVLVNLFNVKPGDAIALWANDSLNYPIAYFGTLAAGAVLAPIPSQKHLSYTDVATRLHQEYATILLTDGKLLPTAEKASKMVGDIPVITLDDAHPYIRCLDDMILQGDPKFNGFHLDTTADAEAHNAFINRSGGSVSMMKSVLTTHAHWCAVMEATRHTVPANTDPDNDVWMSSLSLGYFINGKLHLGLNILLGIPVILMDTELDHTTLDVIERHSITFLFITPPLAAKIAKASHATTDLSSIKWLLSAGAPMPLKLRRAVQDRFNGTPITLEWGTTETLLVAIQLDASTAAPGSSGTIVPGLEIKILDVTTGNEITSPNSPGELLVRNTLCPFAGYLHNPHANSTNFTPDGFFRTRDFGHVDAANNVFITSRLQEMLRVGDGHGSLISPHELEETLLEHPAVASVVVVGIRDESLGVELPTAFAVPQPLYRPHADEELAVQIERFAAFRLTGLKRLSGGFFWLDGWPMKNGDECVAKGGGDVDRGRLKALVEFEEGVARAPKFIEVS